MWSKPTDTARKIVSELPFGAWERRILRNLFLDYMRGTRRSRRVRLSEELQDWYLDNKASLGLRLPFLDAAIREQDKSKAGRSRINVRPVASELVDETPLPKRSDLQLRIDWIVETLRLPKDEARMFELVAFMTRVSRFREFSCATGEGTSGWGEVSGELVTRLLRLPGEALPKAVQAGMLGHLGLIEDDSDGADNDYSPSQLVVRILHRKTVDPKELAAVLIGKTVAPTLSMADFRGLGEAGALAVDLLRGALESSEEGVSVLLHGAPGTGKTEFARLLGKQLGAHVVFVGEDGDENFEPTRSDRLAHLAFVGALADRAGKILLVIDEAEDIFTGIDGEKSSERAGSKVFLNRTVERCPVPTILITNYPRRLGASVLRRMTHAVEFREPDTRMRLGMVDRHAKAKGLEMADGDRRALAALTAPPAVIESGIKAARLAGSGGPAAVTATRSLLRAMGRDDGGAKAPSFIPFDPALSTAGVDLPTLVERVRSADRSKLRFLFHGLPGTGKSAFARHLAEALSMDVMQRDASDLLGAYVGESEKLIRESFEEACDTRRFLIIDEADSLLANRVGAQRSWEVSQVNTMLKRMELHSQPLAMTTNLLESLDPAALRRFPIKVKFGAMTPAQIAEAFRRGFGCEAPAFVLKLDPLAPGDFNAVHDQARTFGTTDATEIGRMLEGEVALKPNARKSIGFGA